VREALDAFDCVHPELIVSDIGLPDADGYALIRAIRRRTPEGGGRTPAIAVTGWAREQDRRSALEAGFEEHLAKPISFQHLLDTIGRFGRNIEEARILRRDVPEAPAVESSGNSMLDLARRSAPQLFDERVAEVAFEPEQALGHVGEPARWVLFPRSGLVSLICVTESGKTVEVGSVGRDGFVGLASVLYAPTAAHWCRALVGGTAWRVPAHALVAAMESSDELRRALLRNAHAQIVEMSIVAACTRAHSIEQQISRWLLTVRARTAADDLVITHEAIADRVGTRRSSVSLALEAYQRRGIVELGRGRVRIVDHGGLERLSCECSRSLRGEPSVDA
jgi:CRP-like cAMP-binding protein